ncbi:hypothetical protein [Thermococcus sp. JCM 11816]|uniref:hypothetical protein n=1 Tax=Thermococcus sp. (strain JCM 11816 / KS-1) TaxID=1295125 RepID=UPI000B000DE4
MQVAREDLFTKAWKMSSGFLAIDGGRRVVVSNDPSERIVGAAEVIIGIILYKIVE